MLLPISWQWQCFSNLSFFWRKWYVNHPNVFDSNHWPWKWRSSTLTNWMKISRRNNFVNMQTWAKRFNGRPLHSVQFQQSWKCYPMKRYVGLYERKPVKLQSYFLRNSPHPWKILMQRKTFKTAVRVKRTTISTVRHCRVDSVVWLISTGDR